MAISRKSSARRRSAPRADAPLITASAPLVGCSLDRPTGSRLRAAKLEDLAEQLEEIETRARSMCVRFGSAFLQLNDRTVHAMLSTLMDCISWAAKGHNEIRLSVIPSLGETQLVLAVQAPRFLSGRCIGAGTGTGTGAVDFRTKSASKVIESYSNFARWANGILSDYASIFDQRSCLSDGPSFDAVEPNSASASIDWGILDALDGFWSELYFATFGRTQGAENQDQIGHWAPVIRLDDRYAISVSRSVASVRQCDVRSWQNLAILAHEVGHLALHRADVVSKTQYTAEWFEDHLGWDPRPTLWDPERIPDIRRRFAGLRHAIDEVLRDIYDRQWDETKSDRDVTRGRIKSVFRRLTGSQDVLHPARRGHPRASVTSDFGRQLIHRHATELICDAVGVRLLGPSLVDRMPRVLSDSDVAYMKRLANSDGGSKDRQAIFDETRQSLHPPAEIRLQIASHLADHWLGGDGAARDAAVRPLPSSFSWAADSDVEQLIRHLAEMADLLVVLPFDHQQAALAEAARTGAAKLESLSVAGLLHFASFPGDGDQSAVGLADLDWLVLQELRDRSRRR